jgi:NYN domain
MRRSGVRFPKAAPIRRQPAYQDWPNRPPIKKSIDFVIAVDLMRRAFRRQYDALVLFCSDTDLLPTLADSPAVLDARRSGLLTRRQQPLFPDRIAREDAADLAKAQEELRAAEAGQGPPAPGCSS